ncbi:MULTISPECIES: heterocyst-inhibiting protein PatX [Nostocales]|uniref:heterocyst-inhibiting protein PatX n=1 Tax=Nostocales TaxID=1161 RepID=UPI001F33E619|nr:hypothetical protein [Nostoc sp. CMAA1605]MCF4970769.1 hypothetical protein [Nostoc sp. CMAA1605]
MRAAVPLLISSLVVVSLSFDVSQMTNTNFFASFATTQNVVSLHKKPKRNQPEDSAPNRGSGRRDIMRSQFNNYFRV